MLCLQLSEFTTTTDDLAKHMNGNFANNIMKNIETSPTLNHMVWYDLDSNDTQQELLTLVA
jgi:hypothetical protein